MAIEELIKGLTEAVNRNTDTVEKLIAGRDSALAQLEKVAGEPKPATRRKKSTDSTEENAAGAAEPGSTAASPAAAPAAQATASGVSEDDLRGAATAYVGGAGENKDERTARGKNIKAITDHFGTKTLVGPEGITGSEDRVQAMFYLKRFEAGLTVDFSAEYDFSGDPAQGDAESASADEEFDIG
jgi:hypothetical protein